MMTFDETVSALVRQTGCSRDQAVALVRTQMPQLAPPAPANQFTVDEQALEDQHVAAGDQLMAALGFFVVRLSQKRRSKVTEGIPDRRYYHKTRRLVLWWEAKAAWGEQRPAQRVFQEYCEAVGDPYVLGGIEALREWLTDHRVAVFDHLGNPEPILG